MAKEKKDSSSTEKLKSLPPVVNFANAGVSGMIATGCVHPMFVLKNRMQMSKSGTTVFKTVGVVASQGFSKFYSGISAGLLRQASYTTIRLGTYNQLQDYYRENYEGKPSYFNLVAMAAFVGIIGSIVGTPSDLALTRMTSDGKLPPEKRRNYKHVFNAFSRIIREEGASVLWRGYFATMNRAVVVNVSQLATYSQTKFLIQQKLNMEEGWALHLYSSMISGIITAFNSNPFDIAKTRIQNLRCENNKCCQIPSMLKMIYQIGQSEGIRALWKGFWPSYYRIGPHTIITFTVNEQVASFYRLRFMN